MSGMASVSKSSSSSPQVEKRSAASETQAAYEAAGASERLIVHREPESGHVETPAIRDAVVAFFRRYLVA